MTIAVLYDIHGNLPALEAVLAELDKFNVDQFVIGGDVVLGPMPGACIDRLMKIDLPMHFVRGNCETAVLRAVENIPNDSFPPAVQEAIQWIAENSSDEHLDIIASWQEQVAITTPSLGEILFCHATPRDENEIFTIQTKDEKLLPIFDNVEADLVICGHTHMQFDRMIGNMRVINAGSVGMPFGGTGAFWLLIDEDPKLQHTSYNLAKAADEIVQTRYPLATEFAEQNVLRSPGSKKMLEVLNKRELA